VKEKTVSHKEESSKPLERYSKNGIPVKEIAEPGEGVSALILSFTNSLTEEST